MSMGSQSCYNKGRRGMQGLQQLHMIPFIRMASWRCKQDACAYVVSPSRDSREALGASRNVVQMWRALPLGCPIRVGTLHPGEGLDDAGERQAALFP